MVGISTSFGMTGQGLSLRAGISNLSSQQQALQTQVATGVASDTYAGLGVNRVQALALQPALTQISAWSSNVTSAQNTLTTTQTALSGISDIAASLSKSLQNISGTANSASVAAVVQEAQQDLASLGGLLNTKSGNSYVLAGRQSTVAPVTSSNLATSELATSITNVVKALGSTSADDVLTATQSLAATTSADSPFSANLSVNGTEASSLTSVVQIGQGEWISVGTTATAGTAGTDSSTGSPIRDLMRNLMVVASLGSTTPGTAEYKNLIQGLTTSNGDVTSQLSDLSANLGVTQNRLSFQSSSLSQMQTALRTQLGNAKNVDYATVSTQLSAVKAQLQASYSVIADMKSLTLAQFI
ncbi:flagellin [Brytella acorum]|uniref:flagellin n=1 Tax=Brytella acorum TaxID=2959299 RepID=UPI0025ADE8D8|nr:flagellin [Brytella acorum]MDF3625069.1 flagellin [Brytella acorum]